MKEEKNALSRLDPQKRETLRKLIRGTAFAIPVVSSFTMNDVNLRAAASFSGNTR